MVTKWAASDEENQWCRTFCQVPINAIYEHAEKGKHSLQGLVAFFRRKAQTERGSSEQLRKVLRDEIGALEEPGTGIRRTLLELKTYIDESCRQQLQIAQVLDEQVAEPLASLKDASESYIQTLQGEILNANNEYQKAVDEHNETMDRLNKASRGLREARDKQRLALQGIGVPVFELQRLAARVVKWEEEQAQAVMARARAKTTLYNRIIARDEMTMAVSVAYQKAEEERLDQLNKSLRRFLHVEKERLHVSQQLVTRLETHVQSLSRAEDIQLFIHNQRDPDNMHFQGKALALLDWQWNKTQGDRAVTVRRHPHSLLEHRSSIDANECFSPTSPPTVLETPFCPRQGYALNTTVTASGALLEIPHTDLPQNPMSIALYQCFADDVKHAASFREEDGDTIEEPLRSNADSDKLVMSREGESRHAGVTAEALVRETCKTLEGRGLFVKCLNRQRSLETKIKDRASFDTLVTCFKAFLDECVREDDVKAAKTAMILAETFYYPKSWRHESDVQLEVKQQEAGELQGNGWIEDEGDDFKISSLQANCGGYSECMNEKLLQHVDETHSFLHGGGHGRGATRTYLQEEVKKHSIWKTPSFWEKALLLAIGEELQRTPQLCPWEELVSGVPKHDNLPSREEAVCRVHNIVFGQLGSFTLSMLEFEVPLPQIESFVETMCDAHELTEDQRFLLRRNLQEIFATLR